MFIRFVFYYLILSFALFTNVNSAESGGMPQLNPEFWISQIFWLTLSFGFLFIILSKFILPKISNNLELRKSQILENIEAADKQRKDSELKIKEFEELISKSKTEAKNILAQAREKVQKDINLKRDALDKQLDEEIKKAEDEITALRKSAPDKINKIAIETSTELVKKLIGADVNASSISAIVNDLSKRNGEKYYGN